MENGIAILIIPFLCLLKYKNTITIRNSKYHEGIMYSYPNNICRNLNLLFPKVFSGQKSNNLQQGFALLNIMLIYAHTPINTKLKEAHNKWLSTHYSNLLITHTYLEVLAIAALCPRTSISTSIPASLWHVCLWWIAAAIL